MTLILQSSTAISSPIFPSLDEVDPNLAIAFAGADLTGRATGDTVQSFMADGNGPVRWRTFDGVTTGWTKPTYGTTGKPHLAFNGNLQQIANYNPAAGAATSEVPQPFTVLIECSVDAFTTGKANSQIIGGGTSLATLYRLTHTWNAGEFTVTVGATSVTVSTGLAAGAWGRFGLVFNGTNSLILSPNGQVTPADLPTIPMTGIRLGGSTNTSSVANTSFAGKVSNLRLHTRALSESDLRAAWQALA